jgi:AAA+ ATPase superfamily predicted ATPase
MSRFVEPPFLVGKPVTGEYFIDRENELGRLLTMIRGLQKLSASNSVLIGLRRTGKSSILENAAILLENDKKIVPVIISCYGISSKSRFAKVLADKSLESYVQKTSDSAYVKRVSRAISEGKRGILERLSEVTFWELSLRFNNMNIEEDILMEQAFQFVETLAKDKDCFFVLMLDEFQDAIKWGEKILKRIRTIIQSQRRVCYVLAGSATSIMHDLVYQRRSPFYRQFVEIPVKKLESNQIEDFMKERFASVGVTVNGKQLNMLATYSDGYPDYAQRIGLEIFLKLGSQKKIVSDKLIENAYYDMVQTLDGEFENYFSTFAPSEREILVSLSIGRRRANEIAREVRKELHNISKSLTMLVNYGVVERPMTGQYRLADAVFSDWLKKRFSTSLDFYV